MAHRYQADWTLGFLEVNLGTGAGRLIPRGKLHLDAVNDAGKVTAARDDHGNSFTGHVAMDGSFITLDRSDGAHFEGFKVFEKRITGTLLTVLAGTKGPSVAIADECERVEGQEDGIWVATKP